MTLSPTETETPSVIIEEKSSQPVTYIVHHDDHDGFVGAAIAQTINKAGHKSIKTFATNYGKDFPFDKEILTHNDHLYVIDFSYDRNTLEDLNSRVEKLLVLDHHIGMEKELFGLPYVLFDQTRSGAKLSWDYFTDGYYGSNPVVNIVDAYDLWNKDYIDNTYEAITDTGVKTSLTWRDVVSYHLGTMDQQNNIEFWINAIKGFTVDVSILNTGNEMYAKILNIIDDIEASAKPKRFIGEDKWKGIVFEGSRESVSLISDGLLYWVDDSGNSLKESRRDLTCCYFRPHGSENKVVVSVRSAIKSEATINALKVAKAFGGGGHTAAAGCSFTYSGDLDDFPEFFIGKLKEVFGIGVQEILY